MSRLAPSVAAATGACSGSRRNSRSDRYLCAVKDPNGYVIEFSFGQPFGKESLTVG